jgi:hypothetical protein
LSAEWKVLALSGIYSVFITVIGTIFGVVLGQHFSAQRDLQRMQIESLQSFEQQYLFRDTELVRIRRKFEDTQKPLTDPEARYLLGFFEDVGTFAQRKPVVVYLVDQLLGGDLEDAYDDSDLQKVHSEVAG